MRKSLSNFDKFSRYLFFSSLCPYDLAVLLIISSGSLPPVKGIDSQKLDPISLQAKT